jgi:histidine triad (HIT) family protein
MAHECIVCRILAGEQPASFVHRDDVCSAFLDINPINTGHVLVVPNEHADGLAHLDPSAGAHLFSVAQELATALRRSAVRCQAVNLWLADGEVAGQVVPHVHLHVIPRYRGDGVSLRHRAARARRDDLEQVAATIREALSGAD